MHYERDVVLKPFTTLHLGGAAQHFVRAASVEQLKEGVRFARRRALPITVLGEGSNVLVADGGVPGLVIKVEIRGVFSARRGADAVHVVAGAGESWDALVAAAVGNGWWGIENLSHIPGSVGAAPVQNIGAYGQEISKVLQWVEALDTRTGDIVRLGNEACQFSYRDSIFKSSKKGRYIITRACLVLRTDGAPNLSYPDVRDYFANAKAPLPKDLPKDGPLVHTAKVRPSLGGVREAVIAIRSRKFPQGRGQGTAGSFFTNPIITPQHYADLKAKYRDVPGFPAQEGVKVPLAWLLAHAGEWRGYRRGGVGCFERQPLVLVTHEGATTEECVRLAKDIARDVYQKTGITIEPEVTFVGHEWGNKWY